MRMIGIGLMGFLLAGVALLLSTMNILEQGQRYLSEISSGPQLVFEHPSFVLAQDAHAAKIYRSNTDHPVILSGFPAYQSVAFHLPLDARPTSGYLQIDATSQVLDGVEGVLRISIHNTRRGEMLLRPGEAGRSLQIPLSPTDFVGDQLVVSLSLQGTSPQERCGPDDGIQAVVEIETTSAVHVTLDRPLQSPRDRVHAWGNMAKIAWPHWLDRDEQLRRLVLATEFRRRGLSTSFDPSPDVSGLTTVQLRAALPFFAPSTPDAPSELRLAQIGVNSGLRRFHRQSVWRERYGLADIAGQTTPAKLDLNMTFGHLIGDQLWNVTVALNNRLLFQDHIQGTTANYQTLINLPTDIQTTTNTLEIVATTTAARTGLCDHGPELVAELLPSTRLILGDKPFEGPLTEVHEALRGLGPINIAMQSRLSALDAAIAGRLLDDVLPSGADFKTTGGVSHIVVLPSDHGAMTLPDTGPMWLVTQEPSMQALSVSAIAPDQALPTHSLSLLITPKGHPTPGAGG